MYVVDQLCVGAVHNHDELEKSTYVIYLRINILGFSIESAFYSFNKIFEPYFLLYTLIGTYYVSCI